MKRLMMLFLSLFAVACERVGGPLAPGNDAPVPVTMHLASAFNGTFLGQFLHPGKGTSTVVSVPGFIPRSIANPSETEYFMPAGSSFPERWTFGFVYNNNSKRLIRPKTGTVFTVESNPDLLTDPRFVEALEYAVGRMNTAYRQGQVQFRVVAPGSGGTVRIIQDPQHVAGAWAYGTDGSDGTRIGGKIVFSSVDAFFKHHLKRALTHELMHIVGLWHGPADAPPGLMGGPGESMEMSWAEVDLLNAVHQLPANDRWQGEASALSVPSVGDNVLCSGYR